MDFVVKYHLINGKCVSKLVKDVSSVGELSKRAYKEMDNNEYIIIYEDEVKVSKFKSSTVINIEIMTKEWFDKEQIIVPPVRR